MCSLALCSDCLEFATQLHDLFSINAKRALVFYVLKCMRIQNGVRRSWRELAVGPYQTVIRF